MDTLRLVEVAGDGALVLMTGDGRRFSLSVDEQVRSAVRRSRNGTQTSTDGDRPGPREVQARIRAGADADQVALQTGLDVDYVRRFEGPVLAERAHVAELARATAVDRGGDPTLTLERVVLDVLTGEGYDVDDIAWDSRRSDGTRWQVVVVSSVGTARTEATWAFDTATRSLEPVDAEAERLTGVERRRRLSAVRETVFDVERPAAAAVRGGTVELLDALARQRGRRPTARGDATADQGPEAADGPTGSVATDDHGAAADAAAPGPDSAGATSQGTRPAPAAGPQESAAGATADQAPAREPGTADAATAPDGGLRVVGARARADGSASGGDQQPREDEVSIEPDLLSELDLDGVGDPRPSTARAVPPPARTASPAPGATPAPAAVGDRRARRRRAAVPSWDEIVFGAKREDG